MLVKLAGPGSVIVGANNDFELTSLGEVKTLLDIQNASNDVALQNWMDAVHQQVFNYLGRRFLRLSATAFDYIMDGPGDAVFDLPQFPVVSITRLQSGYMTSTTAFSAQHEFTTGEYALDAERGTLRNISWVGFQAGRLNIRATWTAGWALAAIPPDVKRACAELIGIAQNRAKTKRWDVETISRQAITESYVTEWAPPSVLLALNAYRRSEAFIG